MKRALARLLVGGLLIAGASGCADDDGEEATGERPLTSAEASLLAEALVSNYRAGGATFEVRTLDTPGGRQLDLAGQVDWVAHEGAARVTITEGRAPDVIGWTLSEALEQWPELEPVLVASGAQPGSVVMRPPDDNRRLDQVIAVIMKLASQRADNAVLIAQEPGSAFLREDTLRGVPVVVLRYGSRNIYWLDAASGDMVRFEGNNSSATLPIVVDLIELEEVAIDLPPLSARVPVQTVSAEYEALASSV